MKAFGKVEIYLVSQEKMPTVPQEELDSMDKEIDEFNSVFAKQNL